MGAGEGGWAGVLGSGRQVTMEGLGTLTLPSSLNSSLRYLLSPTSSHFPRCGYQMSLETRRGCLHMGSVPQDHSLGAMGESTLYEVRLEEV